jgi:hypothetical protein
VGRLLLFGLLLCLAACTIAGSRVSFSFPDGYAYNETRVDNTTIVTVAQPGIVFQVVPLSSKLNETRIEQLLNSTNVTRWESRGMRFYEVVERGELVSTTTVVASATGNALVQGRAVPSKEEQLLKDKKIILDTMQLSIDKR